MTKKKTAGKTANAKSTPKRSVKKTTAKGRTEFGRQSTATSKKRSSRS